MSGLLIIAGALSLITIFFGGYWLGGKHARTDARIDDIRNDAHATRIDLSRVKNRLDNLEAPSV